MGQCYWNATHTLSKTAQNVFGNTIEFKHMTLCLVPEILDTIQVIMPVSKELWIIDPKVPKVLDIQDIVAFPTVGVDNAIRKNLLFNDWDLCSRGSIGNDLPINLSTTLKQPKYRDLTLWFSCTTSLCVCHQNQHSSTSIFPPNTSLASGSILKTMISRRLWK